MKIKFILLFAVMYTACYISPAQSFRSIDNIGYDEISVIELAGNGDSWVGSAGQGVAFYNSAAQSWSYYDQQSIPQMKSDTITSIVIRPIAGVQYAFIGTTNGLVYTHSGMWDTLASLPDPRITGIVFNTSDTFWVFTRNGIAAFDTATLAPLHSYNTGNSSIPTNRISCAQLGGLQCGSGFWAATDTSGCFSTHNGITYTLVTVDSGLADNHVNAIFKDNNCGANFIATQGGFSVCPPGIHCQTFTTANTSNAIPENAIRTLSDDGLGNVWLGTRDSGIVVYANPNFTRMTTANGLPDNRITTISFPPGQTNGWIGMKDGNIAVVDSNKNVISILSGIGKVTQGAFGVRVFPQPAHDIVNFVFENKTVTGDFLLTDINGKAIQHTGLKGNTNFSINVSALSPGIYFYQILSSVDNSMKTGKLQVVK